jgi:hypothetical protein
MLLADAWNLLTWSIGALAAPVRSAMLPGKATLAVIGAILVIATGTGLWEAQNIRLRHVTLHVPSLPGGRQELRIVQLADLHLGVHVGPFRLDRIVQRVQEARPDLLVSTGDLIDSPLSHAMPMAATLATLQAPMGKFAIFGNHEFYVGVDPSLEFHRLAGFEVLRQKAVLFGTELMLVGVDDSGTHFDHQGMSDENAVLPPREHRPVTLLLKHQPVVRPESLGRFDLQLSGHTHGGQVFPFGLLTARIYPLGFGWHDLGEGSKLYVSNGAGTWGPPIRLFAPPEVTLITLTTRAVQSGPTDE